MDTRDLSHALIGFSFLAFTSQSLGCSPIGFFVGDNIDSDTHSIEVASSSYATLEPGSETTVLLRDSTEVTGRVAGQARLSDQHYTTRYDASRVNQRGDSTMPKIGDELLLLRSSATSEGISGHLVGFDPDCIYVRSQKGDKVLNFWNPAVEHIYDSRGIAIDMKGIMASMEKGNVPYMSYIIILNEGDLKQISAERIRELQLSKTTYWKWVGLFSGLAVDCTVFFLLRSYTNHFHFLGDE